jgi:hypothetical protein
LPIAPQKISSPPAVANPPSAARDCDQQVSQFTEMQRAKRRPHQQDAQQKPEVADAVGEKRLLAASAARAFSNQNPISR